MEDARTQLTVELPLPSRALCGNAKAPVTRGGHIAGNRRVKTQRFLAFMTGLRHRGAFPEGRVAVRVAVRFDQRWASRRLDDDNLYRGCKSYL